MIGELLTVLTSSATGSVIGGVFSFLNRKEDRKDKQLEREFQIKMLEHKVNASQLMSEAEAFRESQKSLSPFADTIKSFVRPIITAVLLYQTYVILTSLEVITGGIQSLSPELTADLYKDIVLNIISLTSMAVSFWFGSRGSGLRRM